MAENSAQVGLQSVMEEKAFSKGGGGEEEREEGPGDDSGED